ncbi:MAG: hypothetical protein ACLTJG_03290 [[Clostridium] innocuum]
MKMPQNSKKAYQDGISLKKPVALGTSAEEFNAYVIAESMV